MSTWRRHVSYVGFTAKSVGQKASKVAGRSLHARHTLGMIAAKDRHAKATIPQSPSLMATIRLFMNATNQP